MNMKKHNTQVNKQKYLNISVSCDVFLFHIQQIFAATKPY